MNEQQIQQILKGRFEAVRMREGDRLRTASKRRTMPWIVGTASIAIATVLMFLFIGTSPTPAQALEQVNQVLKGVDSFKVALAWDQGGGSDVGMTIEIRKGLVVSQIDRDPMSALMISDDHRWLTIPKGSATGYLRPLPSDGSQAPKSDEQPMQFIMRRFWLTRTPIVPGSDIPTLVKHEVGADGRQFEVFCFFERGDRTVSPFGEEYVPWRSAELRVDEATGRPTELLVKAIRPFPVHEVDERYAFSYNRMGPRTFEEAVPKNVRVIDVNSMAQRQLAIWRSRPPLSSASYFEVLDAFSSPLGWSLLAISSRLRAPEEAIDQSGAKWLIFQQSGNELAQLGLSLWILAPLDPDLSPKHPAVKMIVGAERVVIELPSAGKENFPTWMPIFESMNLVFKYYFTAESLRSQYYQRKGELATELHWRKEEVRKQHLLPGHMVLPSEQRINQLETMIRNGVTVQPHRPRVSDLPDHHP